MRLKDRVVITTGGRPRIGEVIALGFARERPNVVVTRGRLKIL